MMNSITPLKAIKSVLFGMMMAFVSVGALPYLIIKSFIEMIP